ncbi:MAG: type II toxin-antitoxin system HicB family antitoxin [Nitrospirae bacterium]|nr:MAG: type II toxin-antitoxin system HicB family antitoxin [Nitrospirota bacterium]
MKDVLTHKGFIGSMHFSAEDKVFHGKIEGVADLISFEGQSVKKLVKAFHEAVDDYIELCKEAGKEPLRSCKGSFNVRIPSSLHVKALQQAALSGVSLNQFVQKALEGAILRNTFTMPHDLSFPRRRESRNILKILDPRVKPDDARCEALSC